VNETDSLTDPMLLAEILEAREELEMATTPEEVEEIRQTNQSRFLDSRSALLSMR
jgi:molecular chaperone HscB